MAEATLSKATHTTQAETQSKPSSTRKHLIYPDVIRAYAIILVVVFHVAGEGATRFNLLEPAQYWVLTGLSSMAKGGVALFIMVSGMLLLGSQREQSLTEFFSKRLRRVVLPFVVWAVLYFAWRAFLLGENLTGEQVLREFIEGPVYAHLWFIYMICGMYLITPLLKVLVQNANRDLLTYFIGLWFVMAGVLPLTDQFLNLNIGIYRFLAVTYVGYFIAGYYFRDVLLNQRQLISAMAVAASMVFFNQVATYFWTASTEGRYQGYFFEYNALSMMILSVALFLILKSLPYERIFAALPFIKHPIVLLAELSFGVYLVHFMLLDSIRNGIFGEALRFNALTIHPFIGVPLLGLVTLLGSMLIVGYMRRVPGLRAIVP